MNQVAYRVLVASTTEILAKDEGDYWDSDETFSNDTINIVYRGSTIPSSIYFSISLLLTPLFFSLYLVLII